MNLDRVLDIAINKFHIVLGSLAEATILVYHFKTGHDIGNGVQGTVYAYFAFLAGHALTYQKYPDPPAVDVNVQNNNSNSNTATATADPNAGTGGDKG